MNLRVNKIFSYSGTQTFQTVSICSRSLIFQLSVFVLLLIPCLTLFYHSNSSWWIFRKYLHIKMSTFILSWWRNPCIMYMSFLLALLALLQSAEVNRLAILQWLHFLLPGYLSLSFLLQVYLQKHSPVYNYLHVLSLLFLSELRVIQRRGKCWPLVKSPKVPSTEMCSGSVQSEFCGWHQEVFECIWESQGSWDLGLWNLIVAALF